MALLGLFGEGGLLKSEDPKGILGGALSPNMPMLMAGLGMMGSGYKGALPGLMAGMKAQQQQQSVTDWGDFLKGYGGSGAPQTAAAPSPMSGVGPTNVTPPGFGSPRLGAPGMLPGNGARPGGALSPGSRDAVIRTVIAESGGEGPVGMSAVTNVIRNRASAGRYGGADPGAVVRSPNQFEPWNTPEGRAKLKGYDPNSEAYRQAAAIVDEVFSGAAPDPTRGATHFFAPQLQADLGRNAPSWATNPLATIGGHSFYAPEGAVSSGGPQSLAPVAGGGGGAPAGGGGVPSPQAQQEFVNGLTPQTRQSLARLAANNPTVASALMQQMFKDESTANTRGFQFAVRNGYKGSFTDFLKLKGGGSSGFTLSSGQVRWEGGRPVAWGPKKAQDQWVPLTPEQSAELGLPANQSFQRNLADNQLATVGSARPTTPPPAGYRWADGGTRQEVIPGGPASKPQDKWVTLTPEQSAALNLPANQSFQQNVADERIAPIGRVKPTMKPPPGYRWANDGKSFEAVPGGPADPATKLVKLSDINAIRKEAAGLPNVSRYSQAAPIYNSLVASLNDPDAASDLDFVYGMAQIYDPNSVVREGEQYIVQSLSGLPGNVAKWWGYATAGGKIPLSARKDLIEALGTRVQAYKSAADVELQTLQTFAKNRGIDPADIMPGLVPMRSVESAPPAPGSPPAQTPQVRPQVVPPSLDQSKLPRVTTQAEYEALKSGQFYIEVGPDGEEDLFKKP